MNGERVTLTIPVTKAEPIMQRISAEHDDEGEAYKTDGEYHFANS